MDDGVPKLALLKTTHSIFHHTLQIRLRGDMDCHDPLGNQPLLVEGPSGNVTTPKINTSGDGFATGARHLKQRHPGRKRHCEVRALAGRRTPAACLDGCHI